MRGTLVILMSLAFLCSAQVAYSQEIGRNGAHKKPSPEEAIDARIAYLQGVLGIDGDQSDRIYEILIKHKDSEAPCAKLAGSRLQKLCRKDSKALVDRQIEGVLTAEQKDTFRKIRTYSPSRARRLLSAESSSQ